MKTFMYSIEIHKIPEYMNNSIKSIYHKQQQQQQQHN